MVQVIHHGVSRTKSIGVTEHYYLFGVIKSLVFAYIIVITGSYFGFRVKQGADLVGKVTTQAVVVAISLVIIADSIMGLIFYK